MWETTCCGLLWTCTRLVKSHSFSYRIREKKVAEWWIIPYSYAPDVVSTLSHPWRTADGLCLPGPHPSWRPLSSQGHVTRKSPPLITAVFLDLCIFFELGPVIAAHVDTIAEWCCQFLFSSLSAMTWQARPGNSAGPPKYAAKLPARFRTSATASLLFAFPAVARLNGHSKSMGVLCVCLQLLIQWGSNPGMSLPQPGPQPFPSAHSSFSQWD